MNEPLTVVEAFAIVVSLWCFGFSAAWQFRRLWQGR